MYVWLAQSAQMYSWEPQNWCIARICTFLFLTFTTCQWHFSCWPSWEQPLRLRYSLINVNTLSWRTNCLSIQYQHVIKLVSLYLAHSGLTSGLESSPEPNQEFKQNKTPINYSNNNFPRTVRDNILFITNNANDKCPRPNSPQTRPFSHRESFGNGAQILLARYHFLTHFLPAQLSVTRVLRFVGVLLDQLHKGKCSTSR